MQQLANQGIHVTLSLSLSPARSLSRFIKFKVAEPRVSRVRRAGQAAVDGAFLRRRAGETGAERERKSGVEM